MRQSTAHRDHLRVCGADLEISPHVVCALGSPPRVRSRLALGKTRGQPIGITSACAEQTDVWQSFQFDVRDHLRVCGADAATVGDLSGKYGSPPRVRSRRDDRDVLVDRGGITSACAEQTNGSMCLTLRNGDHLRVCGADIERSQQVIDLGGSPPRVRSRRSTHAANTPATVDHLRVCGAGLARAG